MNQPQSVLRSLFQCHPSKDAGNGSASETTWGPARRRGPTNPQGETAHPAVARSPLRLTHSQLVPTQGAEQQAPPPSPGAVVKVTGRQEGASECALGSREKGAPIRIYPPPSVSPMIGISENGFHSSVSGNQLLTTLLPTNSQTVTVSKIISGFFPKALLQAVRQPTVYFLPSPQTPPKV